MKSNKGITLIALVVTIVVLLILAGVSISMLTGENGIITQAQKAKEQSEIGEEKEAISVAYSGAKIKNEGKEVTANNMQDQFNYNGTKANASGNIYVQFTESKRWYYVSGGKVEGPLEEEPDVNAKTLVDMFKQAQADKCNLTHETCSNPNHLHVGDYLEYVPVEGKSATVTGAETGMYGEGEGETEPYSISQTYEVDISTTWRVLGLDENGTELLITSGSPIKKARTTIEGTDEPIGDENDVYLYLRGAESYVYCVDTLNKICGIYNDDKYASEARSMRIEDINRAIGVVKEGNKVYLEKDLDKTNIDEWGVLGKIYTYQEGDYSPESYLKGETEQAGKTVTATAYYYDYEDPNIINQSSTLWKLLFDGTTSEKGCAKSYWLASPGVCGGGSDANFGPGVVYGGGAGCGSYDFFDSYGGSGDGNFTVRPVVSLKSNITETEVPITTGTEEDWNTSSGGGPS